MDYAPVTSCLLDESLILTTFVSSYCVSAGHVRVAKEQGYVASTMSVRRIGSALLRSGDPSRPCGQGCGPLVPWRPGLPLAGIKGTQQLQRPIGIRPFYPKNGSGG